MDGFAHSHSHEKSVVELDDNSSSPLVIGQWIGVDGDILYFDLLFRPVLLVDLYSLELVQSVESFDDSPENRILPVQVRSLVEADKELASVGVWPLVRHAQDASCVVSQGRLDLILELLAGIDGGRVLGGACLGRAALNHEVGYETVEGRAMIGVGRA